MAKGRNIYAQLIYQEAVKAGLKPNRAKELVAAAMRESGLNPHARNKSSGAAGLFQLLSSGYVNRAKALGGVFNPRANIAAILPAYVRYWQQHPNAAPGAGAAAVEASGKGADWYAQPLRYMPGYNLGAGPGTSLPLSSPAPGGSGVGEIIAKALMRGQEVTDVLPQIAAARNAPRVPLEAALSPSQPLAGGVGAIPRGQITELFYDPLGGIKFGKNIGAIGGHKDHDHFASTNPQAVLRAIALARRLGLRVSENPYVGGVNPVHVKDSYHYRTFKGRYNGRLLGEAFDASGNPNAMAAFYRALAGLR